MMSNLVQLALSFTFGCVTGAAYFYVLWLSVRAMSTSQKPWRAGLIGGTVRLAILFGSFAILLPAGGAPGNIIAWLIGFLLLRSLTIGRARLPETSIRRQHYEA